MGKWNLFQKKTEEDPYAAPAPEREEHASGVETDEYDILPPVEQPSDEREAKYADKECIEVEYSFGGDDIREGLTIYQKMMLYKKNTIYTLILAAIFAIYVFNMAAHPDKGHTMYLFLSAMCVAVACSLWLLPRKHIKKTAEAADANPMQFRMTVYDTGVRIHEENGSFLIEYGAEIGQIIETDRQFLLCVGKERLFMLPKRYLSDAELPAVRAMFADGMGAQFTDRTTAAAKQ